MQRQYGRKNTSALRTPDISHLPCLIRDVKGMRRHYPPPRQGAEHGMSCVVAPCVVAPCVVAPKQYLKMVSEFWEKYD